MTWPHVSPNTWLAISITSGAAMMFFLYWPNLSAWWARCKRTKESSASPWLLQSGIARGYGNQPISGISELERCREELVEYIRAATKNRMVDGEHIAASAKFLPHLLELCEILDAQEIPHPEVELGLVVLNGGEWGRFIAKLWAMRHDIVLARQVYQSDSGS